ncbi:flavodoxin-dependent (E)-4-hydroxy-3-methylbut-2-enyl-diphosphate synthase [Candidatus Margulisiibacteriota bacterium]
MKNKRHKTLTVKIANIAIGSRNPIVIQSMTNTPTANVKATVKQVRELAKAGSELVRITINDEAAMKAIPAIVKQVQVPIIGDFHYNGHILLSKFPESAKLLAKYRINPGNVGQEKNFEAMIQAAIKHDKPVRIGVNWGSLNIKSEKAVTKASMHNILVKAAIDNAKKAIKLGLAKDKIILSVKTSEIPDLIAVNRKLAKKCDFPIHLGLTEAGSGVQGLTASAAALSILLSEGIGDTIRISLTPSPGTPRSQEVEACKALLQSLELRYFKPKVTSCPGCGRTASDYFIKLAEQTNKFVDKNIDNWKQKFPGVEKLQIAVMGCIVNGPGECKHSDIGICLPGAGEKPVALVYIKGKLAHKLQGNDLDKQFQGIINEYLNQFTK